METGGGVALSSGRAWALALTATFTMAVSYMDRQTLAVLAPVVTKSLGISDERYGWLIAAFSLAYLVGAPVAGRFIDHVGARRGLLGAVVAWSLIAALHALAPGFGSLFALRIALGLAESPSFPGAAQAVQRGLPPADRARGFGILFTGSSIGAMVAPPLSTFLEARYGFRVAFLGTAAVGLLWVPVWLAIAWHPAARAALDANTTAAASATAAASDGSGEAAAAPRATMLDLLRHPGVLRGVAVVLASAPILSFTLNWTSKFLVSAHGLTQSDMGRFLWVPPVLMDIGAIGFGHFASQRARLRKNDGSPHRLLLALAALLTASGVVMPFAGGPWAAVIVAGAVMAGGGGLFALLTADMLSRVPPSAVSSAGGITAAAQSLAYIIASPIIGRTVERTGSYTAIVIALGLWVLPGCALWLAWAPPALHGKGAAPAGEES
jgi:ACS family hexuronate transporter-like MFS transporter